MIMIETGNTKEQRRKVREEVTEKVLWMLNTKETVTWNGTKTDLIELIHIAWLSAEVYEPDGNPAHFSWMVRTVFANCNMTVPRNPSKKVANACRKMGQVSRSMEERLMYALTANGTTQLWNTILT